MANLHKNRYQKRFAALSVQGKGAYIPFTMLGWPDKKKCLASIKTMIDAGVSALELGIAFSDPVADGPVIQQAANETIAAGFKVKDAFALIKEARSLDADIPIGLLVYYNMVMAAGIEHFFAEAADAGVDGVLIVDLPPEEAAEVSPTAAKYGIDLIFIVSPLTTPERLKMIAQSAGGFLYAVSRLGITGVEERYDLTLAALIERAKLASRLPVCIGFGISTPEQAKQMMDLGADGVITGSKIIDLIRNSPRSEVDVKLANYLQLMLLAVSAGVKTAV